MISSPRPPLRGANRTGLLAGLLLAVAAAGAPAARPGARYRVQPIGGLRPGPLPPWDCGLASDLNNRGEAVGGILVFTAADDAEFHPFYWRDGHMTDLSVAHPELAKGSASAINDRGTICGSAPSEDEWHGRSYLLSGGQVRFLAGPDGAGTLAVDVNDAGNACGNWYVWDLNTEEEAPYRAAFWRDGAFEALPPLPDGSQCDALALNNADVVVGWSETGRKDARGEPLRHAVRWQNGQIKDLTPDLRWSSEASAVNNRDEILVHSRRGGFVWRAGRRVRIESSHRGWYPSAYSLNDAGILAGSLWFGYTDHNKAAATWSTRRTDRPELVLPREARLLEADHINDWGQMLAFDGPYYQVIVTPVR